MVSHAQQRLAEGPLVLNVASRPRWGADRAPQHEAPREAPACVPFVLPPTHPPSFTKVSQDSTLSPLSWLGVQVVRLLFWRLGGGPPATALPPPRPSPLLHLHPREDACSRLSRVILVGRSEAACVGSGTVGPRGSPVKPGGWGRASSAARPTPRIRPHPASVPTTTAQPPACRLCGGRPLSRLGPGLPTGPSPSLGTRDSHAPQARWARRPSAGRPPTGPHDRGKTKARFIRAYPWGGPEMQLRAAAPNTHTPRSRGSSAREHLFCSRGGSRLPHAQNSTMSSPNGGHPPLLTAPAPEGGSWGAAAHRQGPWKQRTVLGAGRSPGREHLLGEGGSHRERRPSWWPQQRHRRRAEGPQGGRRGLRVVGVGRRAAGRWEQQQSQTQTRKSRPQKPSPWPDFCGEGRPLIQPQCSRPETAQLDQVPRGAVGGRPREGNAVGRLGPGWTGPQGQSPVPQAPVINALYTRPGAVAAPCPVQWPSSPAFPHPTATARVRRREAASGALGVSP